jgi:hypothetical protein
MRSGKDEAQHKAELSRMVQPQGHHVFIGTTDIAAGRAADDLILKIRALASIQYS